MPRARGAGPSSDHDTRLPDVGWADAPSDASATPIGTLQVVDGRIGVQASAIRWICGRARVLLIRLLGGSSSPGFRALPA